MGFPNRTNWQDWRKFPARHKSTITVFGCKFSSKNLSDPLDFYLILQLNRENFILTALPVAKLKLTCTHCENLIKSYVSDFSQIQTHQTVPSPVFTAMHETRSWDAVELLYYSPHCQSGCFVTGHEICIFWTNTSQMTKSMRFALLQKSMLSMATKRIANF